MRSTGTVFGDTRTNCLIRSTIAIVQSLYHEQRRSRQDRTHPPRHAHAGRDDRSECHNRHQADHDEPRSESPSISQSSHSFAVSTAIAARCCSISVRCCSTSSSARRSARSCSSHTGSPSLLSGCPQAGPSHTGQSVCQGGRATPLVIVFTMTNKSQTTTPPAHATMTNGTYRSRQTPAKRHDKRHL